MWIMFFAGVLITASPALVALSVTSRRGRDEADRAWRDGYEQGCDDELASCAPCDCKPTAPRRPSGAARSASGSPDLSPGSADLEHGGGLPSPPPAAVLSGGPPWPDADVPPRVAESVYPEWDDTAEHLAVLAQPYYAVKGDSPGPGLPPCASCGCEPWENDPADRRSHERHCPLGPRQLGLFPASPIFDALALERSMITPTSQTSAPPPVAGPPPGDHHGGGGGTKPPAPQPGADIGAGPDNPGSRQVGAGADPWETLKAAEADIWDAFTDGQVFDIVKRDLATLRVAMAEPLELPPWRS